ncbi:isocitrate/isopropylmalate dehydrogenase family protein [Synechococcales cyanobacterium C]|uniref:Isocitrate/isopropylmalate dehydrogenase family protein n=1 Tax=Petrachloros mirabilis ULC683 TaxID=2781853 RepID=A0A8K1ZZE1_9CYAN|nr:isocitrate/isopropylmalate family dehydrogenase [Petrachloros mirabilis]NCJ07964.1 isocitrate/isopropylmalate dehydrogenase family protein [Petrachloros mirabilis ULC683]
MGYPVTLIRGDGIGPEVAEAARIAVDATGVSLDWNIVDAGAVAIEKYGTPLPEPMFEAIRDTKIALKGPISTPSGYKFPVTIEICKQLNLFANLRPVQSIPGVKSYFQDIDLVILRDNTEDLYAGIEFERTSIEAADARTFLSKLSGQTIRDDAAIGVKPISVLGSRQIVEFALQYAQTHSRRKITVVHQANRMKFTDGLFLDVAREVAKSYPELAFEDQSVDNVCLQLMQKPQQYDLLVMSNLYGDILSSLGAGMMGGLGVAPSANIGDDYAVFEAVHGCAPKYAGQNKANPTALILSGALMLQHLGEQEAATKLQKAVQSVIHAQVVTCDLAASGVEPVGTREMAEAIAAAMV